MNLRPEKSEIAGIDMSVLICTPVCCHQDDQDDEADKARLKEVTRRLYTQMREMELRHQEEREQLQVCLTG